MSRTTDLPPPPSGRMIRASDGDSDRSHSAASPKDKVKTTAEAKPVEHQAGSAQYPNPAEEGESQTDPLPELDVPGRSIVFDLEGQPPQHHVQEDAQPPHGGEGCKRRPHIDVTDSEAIGQSPGHPGDDPVLTTPEQARGRWPRDRRRLPTGWGSSCVTLMLASPPGRRQ